MIRRGVKQHNRSAKNHIYRTANARLTEVLPIVKQMVDNSTRINSAPIFYFTANKVGQACSCRSKSTDGIGELVPAVAPDPRKPPATMNTVTPNNERILKNTGNGEITIKHRSMLFGEDEIDDSPDVSLDQDSVNNATQHTDDDLLDYGTSSSPLSDSTFILGESIDCGVCYRTGVLPGYSMVGSQSHTITMLTGHIQEVKSYHLDTVPTPERFVRLHDSGYIKCSCSIPPPTAIHRFLYSIRNNRDVLIGSYLYGYNGKPILSFADFVNNTQRTVSSDYAGSLGGDVYEWVLTFYVKEAEFTHVCIHAVSNIAKSLYANISEESLSMDYNTINTLSNLTLTMPANFHKVRFGDLVYVPSRNLTLKVSDFSRKNSVDFTTWEYTVNTRQLQPQETLLSLPVYDEVPMLMSF